MESTQNFPNMDIDVIPRHHHHYNTTQHTPYLDRSVDCVLFSVHRGQGGHYMHARYDLQYVISVFGMNENKRVTNQWSQGRRRRRAQTQLERKRNLIRNLRKN